MQLSYVLLVMSLLVIKYVVLVDTEHFMVAQNVSKPLQLKNLVIKLTRLEPQTLEIYKLFVRKHQATRTLTAQRSIERESGCRYFVLLELPYFDPHNRLL